MADTRAWKMINEKTSVAEGQELMDLYDQWADTYDQDLAEINFNAAPIAAGNFAEYAEKLNICKDSLILDVAAGTGAVGKLLKDSYGFLNIDGIDGSSEMLKIAGQLGVYRKLIPAYMGGENKIPINDNSYEAAVMAGALGLNHLKQDVFRELIRVVKPGGMVVDAHRYEYNLPGYGLENMKEDCLKWENEGLWRCVAEFVPKDRPYYKNYEGFVMVYQVL